VRVRAARPAVGLVWTRSGEASIMPEHLTEHRVERAAMVGDGQLSAVETAVIATRAASGWAQRMSAQAAVTAARRLGGAERLSPQSSVTAQSLIHEFLEAGRADDPSSLCLAPIRACIDRRCRAAARRVGRGQPTSRSPRRSRAASDVGVAHPRDSYRTATASDSAAP
jgi:hypothetical protein